MLYYWIVLCNLEKMQGGEAKIAQTSCHKKAEKVGDLLHAKIAPKTIAKWVEFQDWIQCVEVVAAGKGTNIESGSGAANKKQTSEFFDAL